MSRMMTIAAAILTVTATPALAEPAATQAVTYADLDLSTAAGRDRLERRIGAAVRTVCGRAWPTDLRSVAEVRECRAETLADVMADQRVGRVFVTPEYAALARGR